MNAQILRPVFNENQILSAADVNGIVDHARNAQARHNRYLHSWGIAEGLMLEAEPRGPSGKEIEVTVSPGVALDGMGREIVVSEPIRLSEDLFGQLNVAESKPDLKYPVFIRGRDQRPAASSMATSACLPGGPTRVVEGFDVTFGRVGDVAGSVNGVWRILLGFVEWNGTHFTAKHDKSDEAGRRYVGVKAEDVSAQNDRLTLRRQHYR
jgi:hypothetical protein